MKSGILNGVCFLSLAIAPAVRAQESPELVRYFEAEIPSLAKAAGSMPKTGGTGSEFPGMELSEIDVELSPYVELGIGLQLKVAPELDLVFTPSEQ